MDFKARVVDASSNPQNVKPDPIVIQFVRKETLITMVMIDLLDGNVMECEAVIDTGSVLSFLGLTAIQRCAPGLLNEVSQYNTRITGISGEQVSVTGLLKIPCQVAGKAVIHAFVVADIVENVLLGVNFMRPYQATRDWLTGDLVYQGGPIVQPDNVCHVVL